MKKIPDRESKYLKNGTYYAEIICITTGKFCKCDSRTNNCTEHININVTFFCLSDGSSKTATGTIAIQVEDFNDHCPRLTSHTHTMCTDNSVIYVTAIDEDHFPNSAPFEFTVIEESTEGKWRVEHFSGKTMQMLVGAGFCPSFLFLCAVHF